MKIFLDTANIELIRSWMPTGLVDGVTTNPSLLSKEGSNPKAVLLDICNTVDGPVSIEVVDKDPEAVYKQAKKLSELSDNVVVKIPFAKEYLPIIHRLAEEKIKLNITLIFSSMQALIAAKLDVAYISPFLGRLDDIGSDGFALVEEIMDLKDCYEYESEVIAASIRSITHWKEVVDAGVDIITVPPELLDLAIKHPLTDFGIKKFDDDWKKIKLKSFV